jgi:hypothetical protein
MMVLDPSQGSGARGASGILDPAASSAFGSWCDSGHSVASTMLMVSVVAMM